jgi:catechol 2,3-dioxygenase-like lactoylglutathione lyase family enzyme
MSDSRRPVSFIATTDGAASLAFYSDIVGLNLVEDTPFAIVFRDCEQMLRIQKVSSFDPPAHTVHGWEVADIATEMSRFARLGIEFLHFERLDQDENGVWTSPDGHKICWFRDPCGNNLSLTQFAG